MIPRREAFAQAGSDEGIDHGLRRPGIGKTTIYEHFRQFVLEHAGHCEKQGAFAPPYLPFAEAFDAHTRDEGEIPT